MENDVVKKNNIEWIDIAKGILISFIVLGHIISDNTNPFQTWIYSFHVAGFFIINGILKKKNSSYERIENTRALIIKEHRIIIMYFVFSFILLCRLAIQFFFKQYSLEQLLKMVLSTITLNGVGVLWFIPTFVLSEIITYLLIKKRKKLLILLLTISIILIIITIIHQSINNPFLSNLLYNFFSLFLRTLIAGLFMMFGYFFEKQLEGKIVVLGLLCFFSTLNGNVDMHFLQFNNIIFYFLFSCLGTFFIILLSKIFTKISKLKVIFVYCGKNSLIIMLTHNIFMIIQILSIMVNKICNIRIISIIITFIASMLIESIIAYFYNKLNKGRILHERRKSIC